MYQNIEFIYMITNLVVNIYHSNIYHKNMLNAIFILLFCSFFSLSICFAFVNILGGDTVYLKLELIQNLLRKI